MDMISKLPPGIIETILCLLPIQEAARTSILSRKWRFHWIKIPKLAFIEGTFQVSTDENELSLMEQTFDRPSKRKQMNKRCKLFFAIYQVLLMHEGPLHEFTLSMEADNSCVEIDHIIFHLSRKNTVKKLTVDISGWFKLPLRLFSLRHLTDLYLSCCDLDPVTTFNGFGSLTSLCVQKLWTSKRSLLHLLSNCPLLKSVTLNCYSITIECSDDSTIINLFECLPVIEKLSIWFYFVECFVQDRVPEALPTALVHLKYLFIEHISFIQRHGLPFLVLLIKSSPNLETLKLEIFNYSRPEGFKIVSFTLKDYSDIWLEHLNELEIINLSNREIELDFVKLILTKSPVLKKVRIFLDEDVVKDEELKILRILLRAPRASSVVEIIVLQMETD